MNNKNVTVKEAIKELISTIEDELDNSSSTEYCCEDDTCIGTDVGYVEEWFDEYKLKLYKRYGLEDREV